MLNENNNKDIVYPIWSEIGFNNCSIKRHIIIAVQSDTKGTNKDLLWRSKV